MDIHYAQEQDTEQSSGEGKRDVNLNNTRPLLVKDKLRHKSHWFKADSNHLFSWSLRLAGSETVHLALLFQSFVLNTECFLLKLHEACFNGCVVKRHRGRKPYSYSISYCSWGKFHHFYFQTLFHTRGSIDISYCFGNLIK